MKLTLKTITPTLIRSGDEISTVSECVVENNILKIIDKDKLSEQIKGNKNLIMELSNRIIRGENIYKFIKDYKINLDSITKYALPINGSIDPEKRRNVYLPITSSDRAYIPGSTIKGIIRSALLFDFFNNNRNKINSKIAEIEKLVKENKKILYTGDDVLRSDNKDAGTDIMKFIIVRDSNFLEFGKLIVYEIVRIPHKKLSQLIIAIPPDNKFVIEITVNKYKSNIPEEYKSFLENNTEEKLWKILKTYSISLIKKEIEILQRLRSRVPQKDTEVINLYNNFINHHNNMLKRSEEKDVIFLPIGFGKTYYFNSLGYFIPEEKLKPLNIITRKNIDPKFYPSTRWAVKLRENYYPLGWCGVVRNE